jgi:DNA-binding beta-propeller fold protein YncE
VPAGGVSASSLGAPAGTALAGERLYVADAANHRVLGFEVGTAARAASIVLGQPSFVASGFDQAAATSAGGATRPRSMAVSRGELLVVESSRHRVLVHELPIVPGKAPKRILGQPDLSVAVANGGGAPSATTLSDPHGVHADDDRVIVADTGNHRVLLYPRDGSGAAIVLGQDTFGGNAPNRGGKPGAATLLAPEGVYYDGRALIVADTGNSRLLVWRTLPTRSGQPADVVVGQQEFDDALANAGWGVATGANLAAPTAVLVAGGKLFVADTGNNRVLVYDGVPDRPGSSSSIVLGQATPRERLPSADINDPARLAGPVALASDGANLYVADRDANRIVAWPLGALADGAPARLLFNANSGLVAAGPAGLAVERTPLFTSRLYVADTDNDQLVVLGPVSRLR